MMNKLYDQHLQTRMDQTDHLLELFQLDALLIYSGSTQSYHADDASMPYRPTPHFLHWGPMAGSQEGRGHVLVYEKGSRRPRLFRLCPKDFWHDPLSPLPSFCETRWQIEVFDNSSSLWKALLPWQNHRTVYVGPDGPEMTHWSRRPDVEHHLNWDRTQKTDYEIHCLREANVLGRKAHHEAKYCFLSGGSEWDIHRAYLGALGQVDLDLPYGAIVGLNEKCGVLHYEKKRKDPTHGRSFLCDAGAKVFGYGSDITRTWGQKDHPQALSLFFDLLCGMETLQLDLVSKVETGTNFSDLHDLSCRKITQLLLDLGLLIQKDLSWEELSHPKDGLVRSFYPHGLGHMLGIQVHDVGGHQIDAHGTPISKREERSGPLRLPRILREREVVTIEPGIYLIPTLLEQEKSSSRSKAIHWPSVEALCPFGGVRIEDNVVVWNQGGENLTRQS